MACQLRNLLHRRVPPDHNLILRLARREAMRRDQLVRVLAEQHVADLGGTSIISPGRIAARRYHPRTNLTARIDFLQEVAGERIPEPQLLIRRSASTREDAVLMGVPRDGFHGGDVIRKAMKRGLLGGGQNRRDETESTTARSSPRTSCQRQRACCHCPHSRVDCRHST